MKTLKWTLPVTGALALAFFALPPSPPAPRSENAMPGAQAEARGKIFDAAAATAGSRTAQALGEQKVEDVELVNLSLPEVETKIAEIDRFMEKQNLVERSNRGELSPQEMLSLRKLLHLRNQYFEQKINLDLRDS